MAGARQGSTQRQMDRLFAEGTAAGLSDGELLSRFAGRADEAAFEVLAARHGPMILGVCRRILADGHAAEDAFQATFLVLVKRSGALRDGGRLGPWLYGVARRVALRARERQARRKEVERPGGEEAAIAATQDEERAERLAMLDEEVGRLPEWYRSPLILCYFEGLTHEEAARRLGCPLGTVRSRIARARDRLRDRLARRGMVVPAALLASALGAETMAAPVAVPPTLFDATCRAAMRFASGNSISATGASASATTLAMEVLHTMFLNRLKVAAPCLILLGIATGGLAAAILREGGYEAKPESIEAAQVARKADTGDIKSQLDAAVAAVVAVPADPEESKNTNPRKIYALIHLGTIQAAMNDGEAARHTFRQGYRAAEAIPENFYRAGALARLARAQAGIRDAEGSRDSIRLALNDLELPRYEHVRENVLASIISAQAKLGDKESVRRSLDRLREWVQNPKLDSHDPLMNSADLIWATARAGLFDEAVSFVDDPPFAVPGENEARVAGANRSLNYQIRGLSAIARAVVREHGEPAREVLRTLNDRCDVLGEDVGDIREQVASAQARVGDVEGALKTAERMTDPSVKLAVVLHAIAEAQIDAGQREAAVATLGRAYGVAKGLRNDGFRYVRFLEIARGQLRAGDYAGAVSSAEAMGPKHATEQVSMLIRIARSQEASGEADWAQRTRAKARAVAETRRMEPVEEPVPRNLMIVDASGKAIDIRDRSLSEDYGRWRLARIAALLDERDEAQRLVGRILNPELKSWACSAVPESLAESGDVAGALEAASQLTPPGARLEAIDRIASALADRVGASEAFVQSIRP